MGLIMAQLSDSEAVFIDPARARILQTLETPAMLMKPLRWRSHPDNTISLSLFCPQSRNSISRIQTSGSAISIDPCLVAVPRV